MNVKGYLFIFTHINMKYIAINLYHIHIAIPLICEFIFE